MHYGLLIVLKNIDNYITDIEDIMTPKQDTFFDWYVIGGRWSGELTDMYLKGLDEKKWKEYIELVKDYSWISLEFSELTRRKQCVEAFKSIYPDLDHELYCTAYRDRYKDTGYNDDIIKWKDLKAINNYKQELKERFYSLLIDGVLYEEEYEDQLKNIKDDDYLVIVDYHN